MNSLFLKHIVRKIFLEDWLTKLVALAITFALWLGVTGLSTPTTQRMGGVPLLLRIANNTEVVNTPLTEVDIVISGDKRKIDQINKGDLSVSVDLTSVPPGDQVVRLLPENVSISLPPGVRLDEVQPGRIAVKIEAVEEREVTVTPATEGALAEGFEIYGQSVTPPRVKVRGPVSVVRDLNSVSTDKIDLKGRNADFTVKQLPVNIGGAKATLLETVVDVTIRIGEKRIERAFTLPVEGTKQMVSFTLFGPRSVVSKLKADDLNVETYLNDRGDEAPRVVLPTELENVVEVRKVR